MMQKLGLQSFAKPHIKSIISLSATNNLRVTHSDLIVGVIYGAPNDLSGFTSALQV